MGELTAERSGGGDRGVDVADLVDESGALRGAKEAETLANAVATSTSAQLSPFRAAVASALAASPAAAPGEPSVLDALVQNVACLNVLHGWLDDLRAACLAAANAAQDGDTSVLVGDTAAINKTCVALLRALVKLPVTVKVRVAPPLAPRTSPAHTHAPALERI
ncbi:hypothetical protein T492DRAFT_314363 [Pavlovales sp. CCMP2436]|nr:hypothetical protein T492DRAFT_314363 [Pavlovales sp. CCMP2436]